MIQYGVLCHQALPVTPMHLIRKKSIRHLDMDIKRTYLSLVQYAYVQAAV